MDNIEEKSLNQTTDHPQNESVTSDLIKQLAEIQSVAQKNKDDYLRAVADLDNYRRRAIRERDEIRKNTLVSVIESFVPLLDGIKLGLDAAKKTEGSENLISGFQMVADQMRAIFSDLGVQELNPKNESFDPNKHECVAHFPSEDIPENQIIEVTRLGYLLNERLLRPAYVVVSSGKKIEENNN